MNIVNFAEDNPALVILPVLAGVVSWLLVWLKGRYINYGYIIASDAFRIRPREDGSESRPLTKVEREIFIQLRQFWYAVLALGKQLEAEDPRFTMNVRDAAVALLSEELDFRKTYEAYRAHKVVFDSALRWPLRLSLRFGSFVYPVLMRALSSRDTEDYRLARFVLSRFARRLQAQLHRVGDKFMIEVEIAAKGEKASSARDLGHPIQG